MSRFKATKSTWVAAVVSLGLIAPAIGTAAPSKSTPHGSSASALSQAEAAIKALTKRPTSLDIPALPKKPAAGKTLDFMACGAPVCQAFATVMAQAAAAVGWKEKTIQIGLTPTAVAQGYDDAVANHPGGVIGSGSFPTTLMSHQLAELKQAGVPVVLTNVATAPGTTGSLIGVRYVRVSGQAVGDYVLADSKGKNANVLIVTTPATPIYSYAHAAFSSVLKSCSSCTINTLSYPFSDLGTNLTTDVTTYLTAHPSINYIYCDFAPCVDGLPAALAAAGKSNVKIVTTDVGSTEEGYIKAGQLSATVMVPWNEALWAAFNAILRVHEGLSPKPALAMALPRMIMTKSNIVPTSTADSPPMVANYQQEFEKAWHVK